MAPVTFAQYQLQRAAKKRARAEAAWRRSIGEAREAGMSLREIARVAGVSHSRVIQILSE